MIWETRATKSLPPSPIQMPTALWSVLYSRGFSTAEELQNLYSPSLQNLSDPFSLKDMKSAVERLELALKVNEKVAIYADYDLDGSPGAVLLKCGLEALGFTDICIRQPKRLADGYGIHKHIIDELHEKRVRLIVTVDVGITDVEAIAHANSLGMQVIVTDHHLPKDVLPAAYAIVNPNQKECTSGLGHLSGTGVAFYLVMALKSHLQNTSINLKELLDLFALATITDMVPLVKENRALVKHGLSVLQRTQRPGLAALLAKLGLAGKTFSATDISFKLAPKLNALSRLEEDIFPVDLMLADYKTAESLVDQVLALNQKRKRLQEKVLADAIEKIQFSLAPTKMDEVRTCVGFVFAFSKDYHPGVVSVVANQLIEKYQVPAFVGAIRADGSVVGSARSPSQEVDLQTVLSAVAGHLHKFGGHKLAAGFETHTDKIEPLTAALQSYFAKSRASEASPLRLNYDVEVRLDELTESFMRWYLALEPFGMGFEEPVFLVRGLRVQQIKELKGTHLKLTLHADGYTIDAPWFSAKPDFTLQEGQLIDVLGRPAWNEWQGRRSLQFMITDARPG